MPSPRLLSAAAAAMILAVLTVTMPVIAAGGAHGKDKDKNKDKQAAPSKYQPSTDPSQYVGAEVCKTCHEDMPSKGFYKGYEDSPHFVTTLDTTKGPEWHGCEACHGPGKEHVDGGGISRKSSPSRMLPRKISAIAASPATPTAKSTATSPAQPTCRTTLAALTATRPTTLRKAST